MIHVCYGDFEENWIASVIEADERRHAEEDRQRDEPCDGADREYVEVAVAREMRLL